MIKSLPACLKLCLLFLAFQFMNLHGQLLVNGNFNTGGLNCTGPPGWRSNGDVQISQLFQSGNNWVDITGCVSGNGNWIEQDVNVTPGTVYFLTMDLGTWNGWDDEDAGVDVTVNGQALGTRLFNDSFNQDPAIRLFWKRDIMSCAFIAQTNSVTIRITGNAKCTKTSPAFKCASPMPGVIAVDNVRMDSLQIEVPQKNCLQQGKTNLFFRFISLPMNYTCEWIRNGSTVSTDSSFDATQHGEYTLKLKLPCSITIERKVTVGAEVILNREIEICDDDSVWIAGQYIKQSGEYRHTFQRPGKCDSVVIWKVKARKSSHNSFKNKYALCEITGDSVYLDAGLQESYKWLPGGETTQRKLVRKTGFYSVLVRGSDSACFDSVTIEVTDNCDPSCFIPNAFSPNGDGSNDFFPPLLNAVEDYSFEVYNRWGELLYKSENSYKPWDGFYQNELCHQGVYMYIISFKSKENNQKYQFKGTFTLLR